MSHFKGSPEHLARFFRRPDVARVNRAVRPSILVPKKTTPGIEPSRHFPRRLNTQGCLSTSDRLRVPGENRRDRSSGSLLRSLRGTGTGTGSASAAGAFAASSQVQVRAFLSLSRNTNERRCGLHRNRDAVTKASLRHGVAIRLDGEVWGLPRHQRRAQSSPTEMSEQEFHGVADEALEGIHDAVEEALEDGFEEDFDCNMSQGVLNIVVGDRGTWVLNKQSPNRQIWWSSPKSGPMRFEHDADSGRWLNTRDGETELGTLLTLEMKEVCGVDLADLTD